ncbi:hypothetical protein RM549_06205 [Salegentibacter sp. F188]|uniref:Uncharacterized protein n=1 Tax=Autumnicola patrickiae TaxID=3075591 RepID=A0ABU3E081_9FLAO|nr:hypothetical protein [Salegentibacter sp. F188]MDT0689370.1 hypothetical protein [Salegentibacter sp. F188]
MAKQNIAEIIEWLSRNDLNRLEVFNVDTEKEVDKCLSYEDLQKFDAPRDYFLALAEKGIRAVQVQRKIKNGSSWRREGCGLNFAIDKKNVAASGGQAQPAATPQLFGNASQGLNGSIAGLGFPEIMSMRSQADRFTDVKELAEELKKRNAELEADNKRLERENMKLENDVEKQSKPSAVDKLLEAFAQNPQAILGGIASLKSNGQPGLNSPQPQAPQLSDVKSMVVDLISNNRELNDEHATGVYHLLSQALQGNQKFINDYIKLLQDHKIIKNGSNGTGNG